MKVGNLINIVISKEKKNQMIKLKTNAIEVQKDLNF